MALGPMVTQQPCQSPRPGFQSAETSRSVLEGWQQQQRECSFSKWACWVPQKEVILSFPLYEMSGLEPA